MNRKNRLKFGQHLSLITLLLTTAGCNSPLFRSSAPLPLKTSSSRVVRDLPPASLPETKQPDTQPNTPADEPPVPTLPVAPSTPTSATPRPATSSGNSSSTSSGNSSAGTGSSSSAAPANSSLGLRGTLLLPGRLLSDSGSSLISNNGSSLLSNNGAAIIANNGGSIISNNGAAIIANNSGRYQVLQTPTEPQRALKNAFLYLTDRDERFYLDANERALTTTTDNQGNYRFTAGYPVGKPVIVNALTNASLRLVGFIIPDASGGELNLNLGSTLATEYLRGVSYRQQKPLREYDYDAFRQLAQNTQNAILSQSIQSVEVVPDQTGTNTTVGIFDLRADNTRNLRNQYVLAISATSFGNNVIKALSDAWKALIGVRPTAVTSVAGNGQEPGVSQGGFLNFGAADGNDPLAGAPRPRNQIPLGFNYGLASANGHIFISAYTRAGNSGHIRWFKPDGTLTSLWLPTYGLASPLGLAVEKAPTGNASDPGSLLVTDLDRRAVFRVPIVDVREAGDNLVLVPCADGGGPYDDTIERLSMEYVAGEAEPDPFIYAECQSYLNQFHPFVIQPGLASSYQGTDNSSPLRSNWRFADEGDRRYTPGGSRVPQSGRYAHLDSPYDVTVDALGNIYIADFNNQRIRFIPSAQALAQRSNYFDYRVPNLNANQEIQGLGAAPTMVAGAIYTIAGNPNWDPANTPAGSSGWLGDFAGDNGPAQLAKLDKPSALAFNEQDQCLYIADSDNCRVRKIDRTTGVITTVAGSATVRRNNGRGDIDMTPGYSGDGGPAAAAELSFPYGIAFDAQHRLFIADGPNGVIRMVANDAPRTITTVAGRNRTPNTSPTTLNNEDGDARYYADFYNLQKMAFDAEGNLLVNDVNSGRLRKIWRQWE